MEDFKPEKLEEISLEEMQDMSLEEIQKAIAIVDLQTKMLARSRQIEENQTFTQTREQRSAQNKQRQALLAKAAGLQRYIQREVCLHKQGGGPEDQYEGDGKSALYISRVFFSNNFLIQCPRCDLHEQRPHLGRKSKKPQFPGETPQQIGERIKLYNEDVRFYENLLKDAKTNKLRPMLGPTWEYQDDDGNTFIPEWK
jgi:hypothetical protein